MKENKTEKIELRVTLTRKEKVKKIQVKYGCKNESDTIRYLIDKEEV